MRQTWEVLIPPSNVNTTPELRIFILTDSLRFFRRFPQINVGGDSAHLSSFGKRTREPRLREPAKGHVATAVFLGLCVISSIVSEFSISAQPHLSTLSLAHTTTNPDAPLCNSTTTIDRSARHHLLCCNCIPTTLGKVDGFQNQWFRGNEVGAKGGIRVELGSY